jgi:hypothetical protein
VSIGVLFEASVTCAATTVTVQTTPPGSGLFGVRVKLEAGDALSEYGIGVPLGHSTVNELVDAFTLRSKLTVITWFVGTFVAPFVGVVEVTAGAVAVVNENE